jgi:hypothetical protein
VSLIELQQQFSLFLLSCTLLQAFSTEGSLF